MAGVDSQERDRESQIADLMTNPRFTDALQRQPTPDDTNVPPVKYKGQTFFHHPFERIHHAVKGTLVAAGGDPRKAHALADTAQRMAVQSAGLDYDHYREITGRGGDKCSKKQARYQYAPNGEEHCAICTMFRPPESCTAVDGEIDPDAWCKFYKEKNGDMSDQPAAGTEQIMLIRHGATHLNSDDSSVDRIRGWKDIPLSAEGKEQAQKCARELAKKPPDIIVTSDLCRAAETAEIISQATKAPLVWKTKGFRPWNVGDFAGQKSEIAVPILAKYAKEMPDKPLPNGESFNCFLFRLFVALSEVMKRWPGKLVAIVTHHRDERLLEAWKAKGYPEDGSMDISVFDDKGEKTAGFETYSLPADKVHAVVEWGKKNDPDKIQSAIEQIFGPTHDDTGSDGKLSPMAAKQSARARVRGRPRGNGAGAGV